MVDKKYLTLLAKDYPNRKEATEEVINLRAILSLPKGTEYFLSDLHGEHEAFIHMLKSASGVIRSKIEELFGETLSREERDVLASLIYNPQAELRRRRAQEENFDLWCKMTIYRLVEVCKSCSGKYTRSKVRKRLPQYYDYIMDEILHADDAENKGQYYTEIINAVIETGVCDEFICEFADTISRMAMDKLHIIGDIWDRGAHPDDIMEYLMQYENVDIQWGNHDILWMGAAAGNWACIANVLRNNISYNNFDMLEVGYGINLRPLAILAENEYGTDPCEKFKVHVYDSNRFDPVDMELAARMNKAISVIQFKVEGQRIKAHPEYELEHRLLLDKIDFKNGTICIRGTDWPLRDRNLPTVDPQHPYALTPEENDCMNALEASFLKCEKLQRHIQFMYTHGALYTIANGNLLYHGCIPMTADGEFQECNINGVSLKGRALMDYLDSEVRKAFYNRGASEETGRFGDIMWYLWLGSKSPLFGKDQMTTFERCFIEDKTTHKEHTLPYYSLINRRDICEKIMAEFGLDPKSSHILNGHVPVKFKDGESPVKGEGRLFIIDGGMSKAYQKTTGIAGYTFIFNSRYMALAEHKPYKPMDAEGNQEFMPSTIRTVELLEKRMLVRDTDDGKHLLQKAEDLKALIDSYKKGELKERY